MRAWSNFSRTLPDRIGGGDNLTILVGVVEDEGAQLFAGILLRRSQQVGDGLDVGVPVPVHAERDGLGGGLGPFLDRARCDDAALEARGGLGGLGLIVEQLQGEDRGTEGVGLHETRGFGVRRAPVFVTVKRLIGP